MGIQIIRIKEDVLLNNIEIVIGMIKIILSE